MSHSRGLKIASFNVWHGLAGRGWLRFREFESQDRREDRFAETLRVLRELEPDVLLLQELNPVSVRGKKLMSVLGGEFTGRVDQSGLKFFMHGLPLNLATGLGILLRGSIRPAREREDVRKIPEFRRLSGGTGFSGETLSLHLDEQRYAQFKSIWHQRLGRLLIVNTHLHHGFERFPPLMKLLEIAREDQRISHSHYEQLLAFLDASRTRRLFETDRLLEVVHAQTANHDGIIIGGDFNSTPDGAAYKAILADGFRDLFTDESPTWDPIANFENHRIQRDVGFDFPLPNFGNSEFVQIYRAFDQQPRRIDFLFAKGSLVRPSAVSRFGFVNPKNGLAPSDHFGLMATFEEPA